jgi:curved DNA-binding protein CbpA
MERLDRMFMEAAAARASEEAGPSRTAPVVREAAEGDPVGGGGTVASQILKHIDGGDIFSALVLPRPECDDAGRPVWHVTDSEISKAFRKRSLAVHPDKNPSAEAKQAFDKLNDAVRSLRDPTRKGEALRRFADRAFKEKCRADPTFTERAKKAQERADAVDFSADILRQQREHRARVEAKRRKAMAFRRRERSPDEESDASDGDDGDDDDASTKKREPTKPTKPMSGSKRGRGRGRVGRPDSESDSDDAGLARPVLGNRGGRGRGRGKGPRIIL